jgi:23S rRNA pseudouridine2605 synthase
MPPSPQKRASKPSRSKSPESAPERLQKILAAAGFGSRRDCESLITDGRVEVDGKTVIELGTKVDASQQKIFVDGERIKIGRKEYFLVNKPTGVLSTNWDPSGRTRVIDLIPTGQRVFTVGRLDKESEGLMIVTNDGSLAQRLTHPRFGVEKIYEVVVAGHPSPDVLRQLTIGVRLSEGWARAKRVRSRRRLKQTTVLEIVLNEGKNREIRRLLAKLEHKVLRLKRIAIGRIRLGEMASGECRPLTRDEVKELRRATTTRPSKSTSGKNDQNDGSRPKTTEKTEPTKTKRPAAGSSSRKPSTTQPTRKKRSTLGGNRATTSKKRPSSGGRTAKKSASSSRRNSSRKSGPPRASSSSSRTASKPSGRRRRG